jgi:acyl-CoA synthetase (AMP-forming)/AMP-acid ligase II
MRERWYAEGYYSHQTLADVVLAGAEQFPLSTLVLESEQRPGSLTLAESLEQSRYLARALYRLGIGKGDVVAVQLPTWIEAALLSQAIWLLEAVLLPVSAIYGVSDLNYILEDAGAKALFLPGLWRGRDYRDGVAELRNCKSLREIIVLDESAPSGSIDWSSFRREVGGELPVRTASADALAVLMYTSGTTSRPKGVMHSHNTLLSEVRTSQVIYGEHGRGSYLNPWPFGHVACLLPMLRWCLYGVDTVLVDRWEPDAIAGVIEHHRIVATVGVPYFLGSLLEAADRTDRDITSLANYGTGAASVPPELVKECERRGIYAYRIYGSTEHPTVTAGLPSDPVEKRINTDGRCLPGNEVRIVDDRGVDMHVGAEGEIAVRGPELFLGYLRADDDAAAFLEGGWFLTGDVGRLDDRGYLTITDRKKDIIIRGGENISSREVEEVLATHPAVLECAAIAVPDEKLGERVCAVVALREGQELALEGVAQHFHDSRVARQKTPEQLLIVVQLPRTPTGKVQKQAIREQLGTP